MCDFDVIMMINDQKKGHACIFSLASPDPRGIIDQWLSDLQVPGWVPGEGVYSGGKWMPPTRPVGVWGGLV